MIRPLDKEIGALRGLRSRVFGMPFVLVSRFTRWTIIGREKLLQHVEEHQREGVGLVTVSNHLSLFDDPLVFQALLGLGSFTERTKCWYSTACADNFNPRGRALGARVTRAFSEVANLVLLSRAHKRGDGGLDEDPLEELRARLDARLDRRMRARAAALGVAPEDYLRTFLTGCEQGTSPERVEALNQSGLLEAAVRVDTGDWVHFFPEGGRSRDLTLRPPRAGVGKVIFHARGARVLPLCFYGTQDVLPVGATLPRLGQRVVVVVGDPIPATTLERLQTARANAETYGALADLALGHVAELRPRALVAWLGRDRAARVVCTAPAAAAEAEAAAARAPSRAAPLRRPGRAAGAGTSATLG